MAAGTSKWRTPKNVQSHTYPAATEGLIGPNAILQLVPIIERLGGSDLVAGMMARAGVFNMPTGLEMIPEGEAARLHHQLRLEEPELAPRLAHEAGWQTANYIMAHRIPKPAQTVLKVLPTWAAARLLSAAIEKHAWTFAGTGAFRTDGPWRFEIAGNPLVKGEQDAAPMCHWHAAVFERLYRKLVHRGCRCRETVCGCQGGDLCRFEFTIPARVKG